MTAFNTNKNSFSSSLQTVKTDLHSFLTTGIPKGAKPAQKSSFAKAVAAAMDSVDTTDFGVRVIIVKTKS